MDTHKDHADVKIPPPVLMLIHIAGAYLFGKFIVLPISVAPRLSTLGLALSTFGCMLALLALYEFRKARTTLHPHGSVSAVVMNGIYRFTRNPIYPGFQLMLMGFPLNSGNCWGIVLAPAFVISMNSLVVEKEEAYLEKEFRDVYTRYKSRVRRWL